MTSKQKRELMFASAAGIIILMLLLRGKSPSQTQDDTPQLPAQQGVTNYQAPNDAFLPAPVQQVVNDALTFALGGPIDATFNIVAPDVFQFVSNLLAAIPYTPPTVNVTTGNYPITVDYSRYPIGFTNNVTTLQSSGCPCTTLSDTTFASGLSSLEQEYIATDQNIETEYQTAVQNAIPAYLLPMVNNWSGSDLSSGAANAYLSYTS